MLFADCIFFIKNYGVDASVVIKTSWKQNTEADGGSQSSRMTSLPVIRQLFEEGRVVYLIILKHRLSNG
jgi:hypothetical protein